MSKKSADIHRRDAVRILVSWTPGHSGPEALEYAAWLSQSSPAQVRVISTFIQPWHSTSLSKLGGKYKKWFKREAEACKEAVRKALDAADLDRAFWDKDFSVLVDGPSKPQLLTEAAHDFKADLILLGSKQAASKGTFLAGSTADALLHYSPIPLGLIPRSIKLSKHGVTRLNFAFTDENARTDEPSLLAAASLARRWDVPLRILAFSPASMVHAPLSEKDDVAASLTNEWREHSLALLDRAVDAIADRYSDVDVTTSIGSGSGWAGAVDSLKWKKGDLMVLGSNPMSPLERVFLGSTATELLPHLSVPMMVYPASHR